MNTKRQAALTLLVGMSLWLSACGSGETLAASTATPAPLLSPAPTGIPTQTLTPAPTTMPTPILAAVSLLPVLFEDGTSLVVDTVCLSVTEQGDTTSEPVAETVTKTLERAHIKVVETGAACKADLLITMNFKRVTAAYSSSVESCTVSTGAAMHGGLNLTIPGKSPVTIPFDAYQDPPETISSCGQSTPFDNVWAGELTDALAGIWGPPILVYALGVDSIDTVALNRLQNLSSTIYSIETQQILSNLVPALIWGLRDPDPTVREYAADVIKGFAKVAEPALPDLFLLLSDPDAGVRVSAAQALGEFGPQAAPAVPALLDLLETGDYLSIETAVQALGKIGPDAVAAVPTFIQFVKNANGSKHAVMVVRALGEIGPAAAEAAPLLMDILTGKNIPGLNDEESVAIKIEAATALGAMKVDISPALAAIAELTNSSDADTQMAGVYLLGSIAPHAPKAIPYLIKLFDENTGAQDYRVRIAAILAVGNCGPAAKDAVPVLQNIAAGTSSLRAPTYIALVKIGAMRAAEASVKLIEIMQTSENQQVEAAYALGYFGPEVAELVVPAFIQALDGNDTLRWAAIIGLGKMGSQAKSAVPYLIPIVPSEIIDGNYAVVSLGEIGPDALSAVPAIIEKLKNEDNSYARDEEIQALKNITGHNFGADAAQWEAWWQSQL
jgi:HEAT repeat protein